MGRPGLTKGGKASYREAFHRQAQSITGRLSLSQEYRASHKEARALKGRLGL